MIKQIIAIVALSMFILLSISYAHQGLQALVNLHEWISQILMDVFSGGQVGSLIRGMIALIAVPVIVGLIPAGIYWVAKRHWFPYFMEIVWVIWLLQAGALIMMYKAATI